MYRSKHSAPDVVVERGFRSGEFGGHSSFLDEPRTMLLDPFADGRDDRWAIIHLAEIRQKLFGSRFSQSSMSLGSRSFT